YAAASASVGDKRHERFEQPSFVDEHLRLEASCGGNWRRRRPDAHDASGKPRLRERRGELGSEPWAKRRFLDDRDARTIAERAEQRLPRKRLQQRRRHDF